MSGTVNPAAPSVEAKLSTTGLPLPPLQPYIEPFITLTLQSGTLTTEGLLRYGIPNTGSTISYEGAFSLEKLSLNQPGSDETYLGWGAMQIPRMKLTVGPNAVHLGDLRLTRPVGRLIILEDRTFNLVKVIKERKEEAPKVRRTQAQRGARATTAAAPPKGARKPGEDSISYNIGRIRIEDGNMVFADLSLRPKFMTRIHGLKGAVSNLTSEKKTAAEIGLEGRVDQYGMMSGSEAPSTSGISSVIRTSRWPSGMSKWLASPRIPASSPAGRSCPENSRQTSSTGSRTPNSWVKIKSSWTTWCWGKRWRAPMR